MKLNDFWFCNSEESKIGVIHIVDFEWTNVQELRRKWFVLPFRIALQQNKIAFGEWLWLELKRGWPLLLCFQVLRFDCFWSNLPSVGKIADQFTRVLIKALWRRLNGEINNRERLLRENQKIWSEVVSEVETFVVCIRSCPTKVWPIWLI